MTGHGVGEAPLGAGRVAIELRAVNHRYLDVRVRLPAEIAEHAATLEERARRSLARGRVDVTGRLEGDVIGPPRLDTARARQAFEELAALRDELRPEEPIPLTLLSCVPDLFVPAAPRARDEVAEALLVALDQACAELWSMREREGAALAADLERHLEALLGALAVVEGRVDAAVDAYRDKLTARVARLLGPDVVLDAGRLEHEVVLLADRADVSEEIARLRSHAEQVRALLAADEDKAGKRLDFLLQEMSREANTIGAKSADAEISRAVIDMKTAIRRMREQAQNVL